MTYDSWLTPVKGASAAFVRVMAQLEFMIAAGQIEAPKTGTWMIPEA